MSCNIHGTALSRCRCSSVTMDLGTWDEGTRTSNVLRVANSDGSHSSNLTSDMVECTSVEGHEEVDQ